jgi:glycosyltransferase involved in cell wall biosynthesis
MFFGARGIGGAESWGRELIGAIDPSLFEVVVITPAWPAIETFFRTLGSNIQYCSVEVGEPGSRAVGSGADAIGAELPVTVLARAAKSELFLRTVTPALHATARRRFLSRNQPVIRSRLEQLSLDVLHVNNGGYPGSSSALAAVLAAADASVPVRVMTVHGEAVPRATPIIEKRMDRQIAEATTRMVALAQRPARLLKDRRGFRSSAIEVIRTGVRRPPPIARDEARRRLGLGADQPVLGMLARFSTDKDHIGFIDALAVIRRSVPDVVAVLGGEGDQLGAARRHAEKLRVADAVVFPGTVPAFDVWDAVDVSVLASRREAVPLSVIEAMSAGKPVVATDVGAVRELVGDGETGYVVPQGRPDALAERIVELLQHADARRRMGEAGRRRYEALFTLDRMAAEYERLFVDLARSTARS